jgi:pyruvate ferredoxin oxidoreductase beta subunit
MTQETPEWRPKLKDIAEQAELYTSGHRLCAGCPAGSMARMTMHALPRPHNTIVSQATGCLEVASTIYPYTAWRLPWMHSLFENAPANASGIEAAYKARKRQGLEDDIPDLLVFSGDGSGFDIGVQAASGAIERRHNFLYIIYDNNAYANTGIQRSGATPKYAWTTTSHTGKAEPGKPEWRKPIALIYAAHNPAFAATASVYHWRDFMLKVRRGMEVKGPAVIHVLAPCHRSWRYPEELGMQMAKLAVETCYHPLWEYDGATREYTLSSPSMRFAKNPEKKLPTTEWLEPQGRFSHLFRPTRRNDLLDDFQYRTNEDWEYILKLTGNK